MKRRALIACMLVALGLGLAMPAAAGIKTRVPAPRPLTFIVLGDAPYTLPQDDVRLRALLKAIDTEAPAFVVHVGDIKSGSSRCDDAVYSGTAALFNSVHVPFIYTPGDNEWTDCHRPSNGGYDPTERLGLIRKTFFSRPQSLGQQPIPLTQQAEQPENMRWQMGPLLFSTLHQVGSNNNLQDVPGAPTEFVQRQKANTAWLAQAFEAARDPHIHALVLFMHGDPHFDWLPDQRSGFHAFIEQLTQGIKLLDKPVLLIHGDSHRFWVDRPLVDAKTGRTEMALTRVVVFGDHDVSAVRVQLNPGNDVAPFTVWPFDVPPATPAPETPVAPKRLPRSR